MNRGSVYVTANGVKTWGQLLTELYNKISPAYISRYSKIQYRLSSIIMQFYLYFVGGDRYLFLDLDLNGNNSKILCFTLGNSSVASYIYWNFATSGNTCVAATTGAVQNTTVLELFY